jgi:hypothetical protein
LRKGSSGGGEGPATWTVDTKPCFWRLRERERWRLDMGIEVRPRRALEAFWRWEQTWARFTRDILAVGSGGGGGGGGCCFVWRRSAEIN